MFSVRLLLKAVAKNWEYWFADRAWFPDGVDDPEICLLRVKVDSAYYWDSGTNKMVVL
jgi:general stress protein 26